MICLGIRNKVTHVDKGTKKVSDTENMYLRCIKSTNFVKSKKPTMIFIPEVRLIEKIDQQKRSKTKMYVLLPEPI